MRFLEGYRKRFVHLRTTSHKGPLVLVDGEPQGGDIELAARITARYSQGREAGEVRVEVTDRAGATREIGVQPLGPHEIPHAWQL